MFCMRVFARTHAHTHAHTHTHMDEHIGNNVHMCRSGSGKEERSSGDSEGQPKRARHVCKNVCVMMPCSCFFVSCNKMFAS